jgi:hypothetical protein
LADRGGWDTMIDARHTTPRPRISFMDLENERERQRRSYYLSWIGFGLITVWLMLWALYRSTFLLLVFTNHPPNVGRWLGVDSLDFICVTTWVWCRSLGSLFLWSAWPEKTWKRRAGLFVVMSMADIGIWAMQFGVQLGIRDQPADNEFVRVSLSMALGWARLLLVASLAGNFAEHAGYRRAQELVKAATSTASTGAILWFFYFISEVNWTRPGPLVPIRLDPNLIMLMLTTHVVMVICTFQLILLTFLATRSSLEALRAMRQEDKVYDDPWAAEMVGAEKRL